MKNKNILFMLVLLFVMALSGCAGYYAGGYGYPDYGYGYYGYPYGRFSFHYL